MQKKDLFKIIWPALEGSMLRAEKEYFKNMPKNFSSSKHIKHEDKPCNSCKK